MIADEQTDEVHYICLRPDHIELGKAVPKSEGHFTIHRSKWAYCSADQPQEAHAWNPTGGVAVTALDHDALPELARDEG